MKKILFCFLLCTGCHSVQLKFPNGATARVDSFGQKVTIDDLSLSPDGRLHLKGYNNDQVTGLGIAVGALERLAAKGAEKAATGGLAP